jgi:hypothetical protein
MGLGLSICESIVSAHGGTLALQPRSPHGATLRIELPGSPKPDVPGVPRMAGRIGLSGAPSVSIQNIINRRREMFDGAR